MQATASYWPKDPTGGQWSHHNIKISEILGLIDIGILQRAFERVSLRVGEEDDDNLLRLHEEMVENGTWNSYTSSVSGQLQVLANFDDADW